MEKQIIESNLTRWTPYKSKGFYESYFIIASDLKTFRAIWIKYTILSPTKNVAKTLGEVWLMLFNFNNKNYAFKNSFPITKIKKFTHKESIFSIGNNYLSINKAIGNITGEDIVNWEFNFDILRGVVKVMPKNCFYKLPFPKTKLLTPISKLKLNGYIKLNDKTFKIKNFYGIQGHNWGKEHSLQYTYTFCNNFKNEESAYFEAVSGKTKIGPIITPFLTSLYIYFDDNSWRFVDMFPFLSLSYNKWDRLSWEYSYQSFNYKINIFIKASKDNVITVKYHNPDGKIYYCSNSPMSVGKIEFFKKLQNKWKLIKKLESNAFELETLSACEPKNLDILL